MDVDALLAHWLDAAHEQVPGLELFDAHTHLGHNDPDGFSQSSDQLLATLLDAGACGCFVFPMHEPNGYPAANDMVLRAAQRANGLLVPFCRVDVHDNAQAEAIRALAAGARGIKLHPRAERFTLDHPEVRRLFALAHERSLPILIHAGRGIPSLGRHVVALAGAFPDARVILAHAGITDLAWIWRAAADLPNLLFDTSWGLIADLMALFALVGPGQLLFASDAPYGSTLPSAAFQVRLMLQAGLTAEQIKVATAVQSLRIAAGDPLVVAGAPPGEGEHAEHVLLDRAASLLQISGMLQARGHDPSEMLSLARLACEVPDDIDDAPVFAVIRELLFAHETIMPIAPGDRRGPRLLLLAAAVAKTPDVPLPVGVQLPDQA